MKVEVKLFATFRNGRWKSNVLILEDDTSIKDVLQLLKIKEEALGIVLIDGKHSTIDSTLKDGDVLALFPPIGGG